MEKEWINLKVVLIDNKPVYAVDTELQRRVCQAHGVEYAALNCLTEEDVIEQCADADALLVVYTRITPKIMEALPKCKVLVRFGIGYDVIDVEAATKNGIFVCNCPDYCIEEVATHTVAMILDLCRKVRFYHDQVRAGSWTHTPGYPIHRLSAQTVGFIGFGNIARQAAHYMAGFGCRILAYDPYLSEAVFTANHAKKAELDELLALSDIVSLHTPLFDSTYHLINKDSIAKMKDGALLVNTSRGPLVCEEDLIEAVAAGKIAAAALDVVETEPITQPEHPLFATGRITVTPHAAFASEEATAEMFQKVAETACQIIKGDFTEAVVRRIVNRNALSHQIKGV